MAKGGRYLLYCIEYAIINIVPFHDLITLNREEPPPWIAEMHKKT